LRAQGCGVVFVSHKLNEVMELCDRVVVLRHGRVVGERRIADTNTDDLASLMVGRQLAATSTRGRMKRTKQCRCDFTSSKYPAVCCKTFRWTVRSGEIVGLAWR
jgi:ABC-type sugar transport system ATPase subunit